MIKPSPLYSNDTVAIVGVASKVNKEAILHAKTLLEQWQLKVIISDHLFNDHYRFSASLDHRITDLQSAIDNDDVKAIFLARGGYGSAQLIDNVNWDKFKKSPKWLIGFSDITGLLLHANSLEIMSIHGTMPVQFHSKKHETSVKLLQKVLFGSDIQITTDAHPLNSTGYAEASIIGGNLSILCSMLGTSSDIDYSGKILFLEEIGEPMYKLDRMLVQLSRANKLQQLKGVVVGQFSHTSDDEENPFGKTVEELIKNYIPDNIPVAFEAPIGHDANNYPVILGHNYTMEVNDKGVSLNPVKK